VRPPAQSRLHQAQNASKVESLVEQRLLLLIERETNLCASKTLFGIEIRMHLATNVTPFGFLPDSRIMDARSDAMTTEHQDIAPTLSLCPDTAVPSHPDLLLLRVPAV
jgi:hypothetical protein